MAWSLPPREGTVARDRWWCVAVSLIHSLGVSRRARCSVHRRATLVRIRNRKCWYFVVVWFSIFIFFVLRNIDDPQTAVICYLRILYTVLRFLIFYNFHHAKSAAADSIIIISFGCSHARDIRTRDDRKQYTIMMISSFQNLSAAATAAAYNPMAYNHHAGHGQQLHSVYGAAAVAAHQAAYNVGQQPVPYHPADYGSAVPPQPPRYYDTPNRPVTTPEPPNRKKPVPQQPPVQFTRVQSGVPGGTYNNDYYDIIY